MLRKFLSLILSLLLAAGCLSGCGSEASTHSNTDTIRIVTTLFPAFDWVHRLVDGVDSKIEVTLLRDNGIDLHNYQPSAEDLVRIGTCDLFIYVGGESESWVEDALLSYPDLNTVCLMELMHDSLIAEGDEGHYDEHVWLSLRHAQKIVSALALAAAELEPSIETHCLEQARLYCTELEKLDSKYSSTIKAANRCVLLFGDRFPFRYLAEDYNLDYYAAFQGCSAESSIGFDTIRFLSEKADELDLPVILTVEGADTEIAQTIRDNTASGDLEILALNAMQTTTTEEYAKGAGYLSIMEDNLTVLQKALS